METQDLIRQAGPTETSRWLRCPTLWFLEPRWEAIGPWKPYIALGAAINDGLGVLLNKGPYESAESLALQVLQNRYQDNQEWALEALQGLVRRGLASAAETTVKAFLERETVLSTELSIGEGRIDLVSRRGPSLIVTDHKVKLQLKAEWVLRELADAETDWQLWDYAWRASQYYSQADDIITRRHLIVLTPKTKCYTQEYKIKPRVLDRWALGAESVWAEMALGKATGSTNGLTMRLLECHGRYGKCAFFDACHTCNLDSERMKVLFQKKGE